VAVPLRLGKTTVADLAASGEDLPTGWSARDTQPLAMAEKKYRILVRRARLAQAGIAFEPRGRWPDIPCADVEVDFDIEWGFENFVYLWGLRVRQGQDDTTAVFEPAVSYEPLDSDGAAQIAEQFAAEHFLTRDGASLKAVAPIFGFHWGVDDAGGAESQVKIDLARTGGDEGTAAIRWLAAYNESDVAAQAAIRDGLRHASPQGR